MRPPNHPHGPTAKCAASDLLRGLMIVVEMLATRWRRVGRVIQFCFIRSRRREEAEAFGRFAMSTSLPRWLLMARPLILLLSATQTGAAFSLPPSWDPMLMLNVTLNANNQLAVQTNPYAVTLIVAPGAYDSTNKIYDPTFVTFDPAQPYAVLNGTAYSRVYGWYDQGTTGFNGDNFYDTYTNQLHGTNYVWIEKVSGSPELKTYFINEDVTGDPATPYTPIFGTDGSSPKWKWDGKMDHNAYAVDLRYLNTSNQMFSASYHLYIGDATGATNPAFGQTTATWRWKGPVLPVIPPVRIGTTNNLIQLSWLNTVSNLALVTAPAPDTTLWSVVTNATILTNGQTQIELPAPAGRQFFRLQLLP